MTEKRIRMNALIYFFHSPQSNVNIFHWFCVMSKGGFDWEFVAPEVGDGKFEVFTYCVD